jgi:hypothetical protein
VSLPAIELNALVSEAVRRSPFGGESVSANSSIAIIEAPPRELSPEAVLKSEKLGLQACKRFPELVQFIARTMNLEACDLGDF